MQKNRNEDVYLYEKIFNSISDVVYIKKANGEYILGNQNFIDITHLSSTEELPGKTVYDIFDEKLARIIEKRDKTVIKTKKPLIDEYKIKLPSGEITFFETEKTPIIDEHGEVAGIIGIGRNVTDNKALEESLIESKSHQKAILDTLPFMAWLKDSESRFLYVNEPFTQLCQSSLEEMIGKTDLDFFPEEMAEGYRDDDFKVIASKKKKRVEELIQTPKGNAWFETYKTPILNIEGEVIGTTGFARDITEQKQNEIMKNEFISVISHELRTPLTAIKGSLGLISSGVLQSNPDKLKELAEIANKNCSRLITLINDILDIEKMEAGKMTFIFAEYDAVKLVKESIALNKSYVEQFNKKIKLSNSIENIKIKVDKDKFIQVMTNLISNATKFAPDESSIDISISTLKGLARISIKDYGPGIPKDIRHKIFDRFIQGDSSDTRTQGGTGLGLNICETILNKMRGSIDFETEVGKGTTFYFDLPIVN